jgi:hypothetical protein
MAGAFCGITSAQVKKLWVSAKHLGMTDAGLHQLVSEATGKDSIRILTREEAGRVIDLLVAAGADAAQKPRPREERRPPLPGNVIELATDRQIDMISRLLWHLGWKPDDDYFRGCVRQAIGRPNIRTRREASDVIDMLRAKMKEKGLEEEVAPSHQRGGNGFSGCGGAR